MHNASKQCEESIDSKRGKTNFHLPTFNLSKDETDWSLHWPTTDEVGRTCLAHDMEPPTSKNVNSMLQLKQDQKEHLKWHVDENWKSFQKKERGS